MTWKNWRQYRKEKNQFRSYYCRTCHQAKPCGALYSKWDECCQCIYQREQQVLSGLINLAKVLAHQKNQWEATNQELIILKNYSGCPQCGSKVVDYYSLSVEKQLVCWPCRVAKEGGASGEISWAEKVKWYQKQWGINLAEWLEKFQCLPVNAYCAQQWKTNPKHLPPNCGCLAAIAKESQTIFAQSWQRIQEQIRNCSCQVSKKVRTDSDYFTTCESCGKDLNAARKKRVIKNRNDPQFWGLRVDEKILCLACLKNFQKLIPKKRKRVMLNEYLKRGYV